MKWNSKFESRWKHASALAAAASAFLQRGHLFVWSVFGPMCAWQLLHLVVTVVRVGVAPSSKKN